MKISEEPLKAAFEHDGYVSEGPVVFQDKPILVRGQDRYGHFSYESKPSFTATPIT